MSRLSNLGKHFAVYAIHLTVNDVCSGWALTHAQLSSCCALTLALAGLFSVVVLGSCRPFHRSSLKQHVCEWGEFWFCDRPE